MSASRPEETWPAGSWPTAPQLFTWLTQGHLYPQAWQLETLQRCIDAMQKAAACFEMDHEARVEQQSRALRSQIDELHRLETQLLEIARESLALAEQGASGSQVATRTHRRIRVALGLPPREIYSVPSTRLDEEEGETVQIPAPTFEDPHAAIQLCGQQGPLGDHCTRGAEHSGDHACEAAEGTTMWGPSGIRRQSWMG